jgi:hypothetical protein
VIVLVSPYSGRAASANLPRTQGDGRILVKSQQREGRLHVKNQFRESLISRERFSTDDLLSYNTSAERVGHADERLTDSVMLERTAGACVNFAEHSCSHP